MAPMYQESVKKPDDTKNQNGMLVIDLTYGHAIMSVQEQASSLFLRTLKKQKLNGTDGLSVFHVHLITSATSTEHLCATCNARFFNRDYTSEDHLIWRSFLYIEC